MNQKGIRHYSLNRLEDLLFEKQGNEALLTQMGYSDPLRESMLIVQHKNMSDYLKLLAARRFGTALTPAVYFTGQAIRHLWSHFQPTDYSPIFEDELQYLLFDLMAEKPQLFPSLKKNKLSSSDRFFFSQQLASLFTAYENNDPAFFQSCLQGESQVALGENDWQPALIHHLKQMNIQFSSDALSLFQRPPETALPAIFIVGSAFLTPLQIQLFDKLSAHTTVTYLRSLKPLSEQSPVSLRHWTQTLDYALKRCPEPLNLARQKAEENETLREIQSCISQGNIPKSGIIHALQSQNIPALSLSSHYSAERELETVCDHIQLLLSEDKHLRPEEFAVISSDMSTYLPFIPAVFNQSDKALPYNLSGVGLSMDGPMAEAVPLCIKLYQSRFHRHSLFALLRNPCFLQAKQVNAEDVELFRFACESFNAIWAWDAHQRFQLSGINSEYQSFSSLFETILESAFSRGGLQEELQLDLQKEQALLRCALAVDSLVSDFEGLMTMNGTFLQFIDQAELFFNAYFQVRAGTTEDERSSQKLNQSFKNLRVLAKLSTVSVTIDFDAFILFLEKYLEAEPERLGRTLIDGVNIGSLSSLRGIPFKHIFFMGLSEKALPGEESLLHLDLMLERERNKPEKTPGRLEDRRLAFYETLMAAGESLHYSFVSGSEDSEQNLPSVMLMDLFSALEEKLGRGETPSLLESCLRKHKMYAFDALYFQKKPGFFRPHLEDFELANLGAGFDRLTQRIVGNEVGFDRLTLRNVGIGRVNENKAEPYFKQDSLSTASNSEMEIGEFFRWLANPLVFGLRQRLRMAKSSGSEDQRENLDPEYSQLHSFVLQRCLETNSIPANDFLSLQKSLGKSGLAVFPFLGKALKHWLSVHDSLWQQQSSPLKKTDKTPRTHSPLSNSSETLLYCDNYFDNNSFYCFQLYTEKPTKLRQLIPSFCEWSLCEGNEDLRLWSVNGIWSLRENLAEAAGLFLQDFNELYSLFLRYKDGIPALHPDPISKNQNPWEHQNALQTSIMNSKRPTHFNQSPLYRQAIQQNWIVPIEEDDFELYKKFVLSIKKGLDKSLLKSCDFPVPEEEKSLNEMEGQ